LLHKIFIYFSVLVSAVGKLHHKFCCLSFLLGRAITEAVSRWLPTAAARVRARVWQVGFVVEKVMSGQVFSEYFGFTCQNHPFHQLLHHHHNHPGQSRRGLATS
jgi:hypothetical protein